MTILGFWASNLFCYMFSLANLLLQGFFIWIFGYFSSCTLIPLISQYLYLAAFPKAILNKWCLCFFYRRQSQGASLTQDRGFKANFLRSVFGSMPGEPNPNQSQLFWWHGTACGNLLMLFIPKRHFHLCKAESSDEREWQGQRIRDFWEQRLKKANRERVLDGFLHGDRGCYKLCEFGSWMYHFLATDYQAHIEARSHCSRK